MDPFDVTVPAYMGSLQLKDKKLSCTLKEKNACGIF
jgi:hypothetical protein